jgi:hypothetical protein
MAPTAATEVNPTAASAAAVIPTATAAPAATESAPAPTGALNPDALNSVPPQNNRKAKNKLKKRTESASAAPALPPGIPIPATPAATAEPPPDEEDLEEMATLDVGIPPLSDMDEEDLCAPALPSQRTPLTLASTLQYSPIFDHTWLSR